MDAQFMARQAVLKPHMRSMLIEWMQHVCDEFCCSLTTYHYAVSYLDRYLAKHADTKSDLFQLVGTTCVFIAAKVEDVKIPTLEDMVFTCDGLYSASEIAAMEKAILLTL